MKFKRSKLYVRDISHSPRAEFQIKKSNTRNKTAENKQFEWHDGSSSVTSFCFSFVVKWIAD